MATRAALRRSSRQYSTIVTMTQPASHRVGVMGLMVILFPRPIPRHRSASSRVRKSRVSGMLGKETNRVKSRVEAVNDEERAGRSWDGGKNLDEPRTANSERPFSAPRARGSDDA